MANDNSNKALQDKINGRIKCRAFKDEENPDARESLCGEPMQTDDDGRQFFEVPGHQREYLMKLLPSYDFTDIYEVGEAPPPAEKNPTLDELKKQRGKKAGEEE